MAAVRTRCEWAGSDPLSVAYHDDEWGVPLHEDRALSHLPSETAESKTMSRELRKRGFRFVGPTICYAFMQAAGLVNDHVVDCFRYSEVGQAPVRGSRNG